MAHASTEVARIRQAFTTLTDAVAEVERATTLYTDLGGDAFFAKYMVSAEGAETTDISLVEFLTGIQTAQGILKALTPETRAAIAKLRT